MRNCLPPLWNSLFISTPGSELGLAVNLPSALWPGLAASSPTTWHATGSRRLRRLLNSSALLLEMMVLCTTKKAALTLFACFFKLCLPLGMPTLEFGCFARVPGMAEGGVCLYARHCQLRALQQFDSVVREAYSSITGLHHTPSALLQRPLGSISEFIFKFYPPHCLNSQIFSPNFGFIFNFHPPCLNSQTFRLIQRFIFNSTPLPCFTDLPSQPVVSISLEVCPLL